MDQAPMNGPVDHPPLSILELVPVGQGTTPAAALASSVELARLGERLGYRRLWVAEHHAMPAVASSAPAVLIAHLASATSVIRIGAGGVMLPNHAPLVVAEQFATLEALHPGRIDLGIGRAPGTDPVTAAALRRTAAPFAVDEFPEQLRDLFMFFGGTHPHITAVPGRGYRPAVWMLGSSDYSAQAAGAFGLPFSFAHHFASHNTVAALDVYRAAFRGGPGGSRAPARCPSSVCGRAAPPSSRRPKMRQSTSSHRPNASSFARGPRRSSSAIPRRCARNSKRSRSAPALTS